MGFSPNIALTLLNVAVAFVALFMVFLVVAYFYIAMKDVILGEKSDAEKVFWMGVLLFVIPPVSIPMYFFVNSMSRQAWIYIVSIFSLTLVATGLFALNFFLF